MSPNPLSIVKCLGDSHRATSFSLHLGHLTILPWAVRIFETVWSSSIDSTLEYVRSTRCIPQAILTTLTKQLPGSDGTTSISNGQ